MKNIANRKIVGWLPLFKSTFTRVHISFLLVVDHDKIFCAVVCRRLNLLLRRPYKGLSVFLIKDVEIIQLFASIPPWSLLGHPLVGGRLLGPHLPPILHLVQRHQDITVKFFKEISYVINELSCSKTLYPLPGLRTFGRLLTLLAFSNPVHDHSSP